MCDHFQSRTTTYNAASEVKSQQQVSTVFDTFITAQQPEMGERIMHTSLCCLTWRNLVTLCFSVALQSIVYLLILPLKSTSVVPHSVRTTFDLRQMVFEALSRSSYVSDDDQLSELSELSEADSDKGFPSSQPAYRTSRQTQDDESMTQENKNLLTRAVKLKARNKAASKKNKKKKKANACSEHQLRQDPQLANNHVRNAHPVASSYDAANMNISARGYIGKRDNNGDERTYSLDEMLGEDSIHKFKLKKWDARLVGKSTLE